MDDLIQEFIAETREMLEALSGEIVAWEGAPDDRRRLDEIFRFVHTVKGNSGFFDLPRIGALSHAAEDALAEVRAGRRAADAALVSAVLAIIDRLGELVQALESGESLASADDEPLIAALSGNGPAADPDAHEALHPAAGRGAVRTIRLPVDLLDRMMSGVSDLVLARNELARRLRDAGCGIEAEGAFARVSGSIADLRDAITRTRMQRIENLFAPLPRMVRDLAAEVGKQVTLEIDGGDVELDREMLEMIRDPLTHIVRNAIDHGIESAAERRAAGKREAGALHVCARQAGNQILIEICDDGRGIDGEALVAKALAAGILSPERAEALTPARRTALIFEPGLSTAGEVTAISGRGVGMDVVRANIERIGGVVDVASKPGEGVGLTLRVPLTLTIIPALTIRSGGQDFAVPRSAIEEIVRVKGGLVRIEHIGGAGFATIRGRRIPLLSLASTLGAPDTVDEAGLTLIVLRPAGGEVFALSVDGVHDHEELVVKPASPAVMAAGIYAGTTLADDGKPVLLLDPPGIAARAGVVFVRAASEAADSNPVETQPQREAVSSLLFKTLAGATRLVPIAAIERIEEVAAEAVAPSGGGLNVTLGDHILPLQGCGAAAPGRPIRVLRLTDGTRRIAYGFDEVIDIVPFAGEVIPAVRPGEAAGVTLIGGRQVELLDLAWLFAGAAERGEPRFCTLPAGDPWIETILAPLVEAAGYEIRRAGEAGAEEVAVAAPKRKRV